MSIRLKLTLYWAAVLTAIVAVAGLAAILLFAREQWSGLDGALMEEADTAAAGIARLNDPLAASALLRRLSAERDLGPGHRVRVVAADGDVIDDFGDTGADLPAAGGAPIRAMRDGVRNRFRFAIVPLTIAGRPVVIEDGVDSHPLRASIARLGTILMLLLPLMLAACVAGGYVLAGRALVPIDRLARELSGIDPRDLHRRLAAAGDDEVARLSGAINALLDRVERAAAAERRFAADAAHELRTPLAVLRAGLEVALGRARPPAEYERTLGAALGEVVGLCAMADQLLALARLDQSAAIAVEPLELGPLVREVAEAVGPLAQAKGLALETSIAQSVFVAGNRLDLKRLLINLLDNALAFTPAGGRIELALAARDDGAQLRVADTGPGIAPADLPLIFERFFRGAARTDGGTGLGLSLCREIARLHRGKVAAVNRAGGGSEFVVTLPLLTRTEASPRAAATLA